MHKILLVEDDDIIRQQVKQLLEQWGYEVVAVEGFYGRPRDLCRNRPPLDSYGYWPSTLQWVPLVPGDSWVSKVPIMFLSSRDQAMDIVMAINMGGDDFVTKAF